MDKHQYKTYKIGKLLISKINGEITFLYKGKKGTSSQVIFLENLLGRSKKLLFLITSILIIYAAYYAYNKIDFHSFDNNSSLYDDEKEKNELLLSQKTDFSDQKPEILKIRDHTVGDGDTLSELAKKYGVSMDTICGSNQLRSYDFIHTGKKLKIPNKDGILHTVIKGQSVTDIAKNYKVSVEKVLAENNKKNYDFISIGDIIFIPDAKPLDIIPGFLWPAQVWRITSNFGWRRNPINGVRHFHEGLDLRSRYQLIRATKYGKVAYTGWLGGYGYTIIIAHPGGWKSLYGHLLKILVRPGQTVKQGQYIGRSGNTGYSTGPHLHFELIKHGRHQNPRKYLKYN